mgnify:CR=1 FL=1
MTILENKLNIDNQIDLAKAEEKISKQNDPLEKLLEHVDFEFFSQATG